MTTIRKSTVIQDAFDSALRASVNDTYTPVPPFETYNGDCDIADKNGHVCTAENAEFAKLIVAALNAYAHRALPIASETTGYVAMHSDGYADWSSLTITADQPDILLSPGFEWKPCAVRPLLDDADQPTLTTASEEDR
jgi:hypothetical protein